MSARDSKDAIQEPPLSQLWPNFGCNIPNVSSFEEVNASGGGNTVDINYSFNRRQYDQASFDSLANSGTNSNSTNYVNFNQFIHQHNLIQTSSVSTNNDEFISLNNVKSYQAVPKSSLDKLPGNVFGQELLFDGNCSDKNSNQLEIYNAGAHDLFFHQPNPFSSSENKPNDPFNTQNFVRKRSDSLSNDLMNNDNTYIPSQVNSNTNNYHCENLYTPFSTTYYANPFATGFDFMAKTTTKLQATAPEFVPRFGQLTINEATTNDNNVSKNENDAETKFNGTIQEYGNKQINLHEEDNPTPKSEKFMNSELNQLKKLDHENSQDSNIKSNSYNNNNFSSQSYYPKRLTNRLEKNMERFSRNFVDNKKCNDSSSNSNSSSPSTGGANSINASNQVLTKQDSIEFKESENCRYPQNFRDGRAGFNLGDNSDFVREERLDRYLERSEIRERSNFSGTCRYNRERDRDRERDYHQRYDNYRSNKRRDDWNRNRHRVEEKFSTDNNSKDSPFHSPEKKLIHNGKNKSTSFAGTKTNKLIGSPKKQYAENEKLSQREKLVRDIEMRRLECLVCVEPIKTHQGVWSCHNCYHILHLQCIIKWASSSKSEDGWRCPACQNVEKDVPQVYYCFCGKVKNPSNNRQDLAHSCGEICGRIEGCLHACTLLCHPGPCPPCQAYVKRTCGCGKTTKMMQCCLKEAISCEAICSKLLNCEIHKCDEKCHLGKCPPCKEKVVQKCHCSKQERQVACTRDSHNKLVYSCGKACGKELSCGNHKCKDCCHANECRPCKLSPEIVISCPCGKVPVKPEQRKSCLDVIPVCDGICGKTLRCGKPSNPHHCTNKCHLGPCPPCNKQTAVKCRCGHMDQMIKCRQLSTRADDARCKKRCTKKRSCGKHKCNQECCIDIDHICPLPCTYTLSCGKHKCDQPCHRGNCPPCYRSSFEELFCECGAEVIYPPVPCGTKRPLCKRPCSRKHPCEHPPQHNCHSATNCPPCMILTTRWCYGKHEQRKTIPCSQQSFSCGLACNKPLPCGRHKCIKTCHEGPCQTTPSELCKQSCPAIRKSCGHKCMAPCHEGDCPDTQCKEMVEVQCECGNRKQMRPCHDLAREYSRIATAQLASSMAEMQRGNYMELSEILAPIKLTNKINKTLDCNDECRTLERNRRLAIGLQVRNPNLPQKLMTKYSDFVRNFAKRDPILVKSIHEALTTLVKLAKESKQKSRSHSFPKMNREKRQLVHEMCEMFGVESIAYDAEPNRNVVATAYKDRSWLPAISVMDVLQRESGQRRVPVPSNNAWGSKR